MVESNSQKEWYLEIAVAAILTGSAVMLGAFGSHMLEGHLTERLFRTFQIATSYQLTHGVGLLALVAVGCSNQLKQRLVEKVFWLITTGILIFSGSLYLLVVTDIKRFGVVTPVGGSLLIIGWLFLAFACARGALKSWHKGA